MEAEKRAYNRFRAEGRARLVARGEALENAARVKLRQRRAFAAHQFKLMDQVLIHVQVFCTFQSCTTDINVTYTHI